MRIRRRHLALLAAPALLAGVGVARSHDAARPHKALQLQRIAHVDPKRGYSGDVYGHRGYVYLSSWHGASCPALGVRVFDVHRPNAPRQIATFADDASDSSVKGTWTEKTIVQHVATPAFTGELAVTTFQSCHRGSFQGFGLYDVTNPARPRRLALVHLEPRGSHEIWLNPRGRRAYVYTAIPMSELLSSPDYDPQTRKAKTPGQPDFRIFDVTDPTHPVKVAEWGAWRKLGINPNRGYGSFPANFVHSVITNPSATRAFLSYWDLGTVILDIRNPARPRYLGRTQGFDTQGDAHSAALSKNGKLLIETHETVNGRPTLFDISRPSRPRKLSTISVRGRVTGTGFTNGVHDPKIRGNRAYFSWYRRGVVAADISRPRRPRILARFVPPPAADQEHVLCQSQTCTLVWGVYPMNGYVYASDLLSGLWVLRLR